jgi:hypothetical protein
VEELWDKHMVTTRKRKPQPTTGKPITDYLGRCDHIALPERGSPGTLRNDPVPGLVASFATKKELKSNTFTLSNQLSQGHCVLF